SAPAYVLADVFDSVGWVSVSVPTYVLADVFDAVGWVSVSAPTFHSLPKPPPLISKSTFRNKIKYERGYIFHLNNNKAK
ncbi:hypothetical protein ACR2RQ_001527, partial [Cronobacter dublinensis]